MIDEASIKLCKIAERSQCGNVAVIVTFVVDSQLSWTLHVHNRHVDPSQCGAQVVNLPTVVTPKNVNNMLQ